MSKKPIIAIIGLMIFSFSFGQTNPTCDSIIEEAVPHIENRDWLKAAQIYAEAFKTVGNNGFLADREIRPCYRQGLTWPVYGRWQTRLIVHFRTFSKPLKIFTLDERGC